MAQNAPSKPTACLALADGTLFYGIGFGATGQTEAELCFTCKTIGVQDAAWLLSFATEHQIVAGHLPLDP